MKRSECSCLGAQPFVIDEIPFRTHAPSLLSNEQNTDVCNIKWHYNQRLNDALKTAEARKLCEKTLIPTACTNFRRT